MKRICFTPFSIEIRNYELFSLCVLGLVFLGGGGSVVVFCFFVFFLMWLGFFEGRYFLI